MSSDLESRVIELESIVSYQDQMLEDLNGVIIEQQKNIDTFEKELTSLKSSIQSSLEEMNDKKPPHY
ncbi:MAG: SlyX family protein [Lentisphaeraceae bacterium]|nr:SlyX family protein [Lentisphaeraceae bacterium]